VRYPAFIGAGVAASALAALLGYAQKLPCSSGGAWNSFTSQFRQACYTDIYPLYYNEGLSSGQVPYTGHPVEYPVLIGALMQLAAWAVHSVVDPFARGKDFYYVTIVLLAVCLVAGVLATAYTASRGDDGFARPGRQGRQGQADGGPGDLDAGLKAALMVALSPALILAAFINWDLLAMALTAGAMAAWAGRREVFAGLLLGLAVAAKFYPLLVFAALLLLCLRAGRMREFGRALAAGAVTWLVVNLPIALAAPAGWGRFYAFSRSRGADWGSIWYLLEHFNVPVLGNSSVGELNLVSSAFLAVALVAIAVFAFAAARRPRLPQLCFLLLAAFLMLNKVWSPQYVIWLVPIAVLARPRLWPYLLWQLTEVAYFFGIWGYFVYLYQAPDQAGVPGFSPGWYFATLVARLLAVGLLVFVVVQDILHPERDVVRARGHDDPAGGVLDGAPDRLVIVWQRGARRPAQASASLSRSQPMSAASPASGVSQTTGAPAALTTSSSTVGSMVPVSKLACRSAPEPNSSRELLQCTRSIRPVIALIRSTAPERSMPAELAWQVSRQNPTSPPPPAASLTASQSRAMASSDLAIAPSPPAVFSMSSGSGRSIRSIALRQFSRPSAGSIPEVTWPPCTISAFAPIDAAALRCWSSSLRDGIRIRLLLVATLIT
jgi:glycosyl transferase family 87